MTEPRTFLSKESVAGLGLGEGELLRRLAAHRAQFLAFARASLRDADAAEDLVNEAFIRALSHVNELRSDEAALAWFYRSLRNGIIDHHRRRGSADRALERWAAETDTVTEPSELTAPGLCRCVMKVVASLKSEYAEALERIEINDVAVAAFAQEHAISSSNAAVRVFRAREALRRGVIATCGACAEGGCVDCTCEDTASEERRFAVRNSTACSMELQPNVEAKPVVGTRRLRTGSAPSANVTKAVLSASSPTRHGSCVGERRED